MIECVANVHVVWMGGDTLRVANLLALGVASGRRLLDHTFFLKSNPPVNRPRAVLAELRRTV
jgi:hypothetical protein